MKLSQVKQITVNSAVTSATLLIIVAGATCFGRLLTLESIPGGLRKRFCRPSHRRRFSCRHEYHAADRGHVHGHHLGDDDSWPGVPAHAGCIQHQLDAFRTNYDGESGHRLLHAPMGVSLYITGAIANRNLIYVSKAVMPFIAIQIFVLLLITFLPDVVLWFPSMMGFE
jgi:hypothetical protein